MAKGRRKHFVRIQISGFQCLSQAEIRIFNQKVIPSDEGTFVYDYFSTTPLKRRSLWVFTKFPVTVIDLFWFPVFPLELKAISMKPSSPGAISSLLKVGAVHPQEGRTRVSLSGCSPVFLNLKMCLATFHRLQYLLRIFYVHFILRLLSTNWCF